MTWLAFGLAASLLAQPPQTPPPPAPPVTPAATGDAYFLFIQGRMLEGRGDVAGAIAAYRQAIALVPAAADVLAELAGLYARDGRATEALTEAEAALKIDAANHEAHRILGLVRAALADNAPSTADRDRLVTQAIGHLEQALAGGRRDPGVEISLGRLYVRTSQHAKAIAMLRAFLNDQPGYPEGVLLLVESLDATGKVPQAIIGLEPLVRDEPDLVQARSWLADLYERSGRPAEALPHWRELARANPRNGPLRTRYATALVNAGQLDAGRQALLEAAGDAPRDVSLWYLLSQVENRAGNADAAEAAARRISDIDSSDPRGPLALAEAKSARGDHRGAAATLDPLLTALRAGPGTGMYARVAIELASALEASGDRGRAVRVLEDARTRDDGNTSVLFELASAYERDRRYDPAERAYRELLRLDPADPAALNALGFMLADRREKLDDAVALVKRALAIDPDNPSYLDSLGWAYVQKGQAGLGRASLERAASARPASSVVLDHLAEAFFQLRQYRDAAATWDRALAGDRDSIDVEAVTKKRDRARHLAGR